MQRTFLAMYFVTTGWVPLFYGIYLASNGQFIVAGVILLISFCGFRQVYDTFNYQEKLENQRRRLVENFRVMENQNKTIERLYKERYDN
jgi:hypothetical protein